MALLFWIYCLPDPQLNSMSPSIGVQGQQLSVSISGSGAQFIDTWSGNYSAQLKAFITRKFDSWIS